MKNKNVRIASIFNHLSYLLPVFTVLFAFIALNINFIWQNFYDTIVEICLLFFFITGIIIVYSIYKTIRLKLSKRPWVVGLIISPLLFAFLFLHFAFGKNPTVTKLYNAKVSWLPESATNISSMSRGGFAMMVKIECDLPEDDFLKLAKEEEWDLSEEEEIFIYNEDRIPGLPPFREIPYHNESINIIISGYIHANTYPNGGGTRVIYDKDLKRMFYEYNHN